MLYIDIDIHHGDGVEEAFYLTDRYDLGLPLFLQYLSPQAPTTSFVLVEDQTARFMRQLGRHGMQASCKADICGQSIGSELLES